MKIIHCADLHLDSRMTSNLNPDKAKERKAEILNTFVNMVDYASAHEVDAIIIAGDMFDTSNISALTRNTVERTIRSNKDIEFYYLMGNHDRDNFLSGLESIPDNLFLFTDSFITYYPKGNQNITITGIELNAENNNGVANSLLLSPSRFNIVTMHGQESVSVGKDKTQIVNIKELRNKNIDYLALGHIHSFSEGKIDERGNFCYSGCLEGRGFDETGTKGFVLLEIDEKNRKIKPVFIKSSIRIIYKNNIDITNLEFYSEILDKILLEVRDVSESSLIKINLTGQVSEKAEVLAESFEKQLYERFFCVRIYDETETKIDYEKYRNDFSLKGEFVRLVESKNISEKQKSFIIKTGLRALAGKSLNQENLICL